MQVRLTKDFTFEAAQTLPIAPELRVPALFALVVSVRIPNDWRGATIVD